MINMFSRVKPRLAQFSFGPISIDPKKFDFTQRLYLTPLCPKLISNDPLWLKLNFGVIKIAYAHSKNKLTNLLSGTKLLINLYPGFHFTIQLESVHLKTHQSIINTPKWN